MQSPSNMDPKEQAVQAAEATLIRRARRVDRAIRLYRDIQFFFNEIAHERSKGFGLLVKPVAGALEQSARDAYEEILLWRTARAELDRRIEAFSPAAQAAKK